MFVENGNIDFIKSVIEKCGHYNDKNKVHLIN